MQPEQEAFLEKLFRGHFNELELYAYALLKNHADARETVQDAFHTACSKIDELTESPNPVGWMHLTVKNTARNRIKQRNRELMLVMPLTEYLELPADAEFDRSEFWEQCRSVLTKDEMELLVSVVVDETPYSVKAKELGITMWACYKRVKRALEKLRQGLEDKN